MVDAIDGDGRADRDGEQQNKRRSNEARQRGFAPAPAPEFFRGANGSGLNRFIAQETAEVFRQRLRRLVAAGRLFLQAFLAEGFEVGPHAGIEQARRDRLLVHHLLQRVGERLAHERRAAREQVIENCAERIDVAAPANQPAFGGGLLRRHVVGRAEHLAAQG